jgi:hypothetical protein
VGDRVEILQPPYLAGKIGLILGQEDVILGQSSDSSENSRSARWLIQVIPDEFVVSLKLDEFRPCK